MKDLTGCVAVVTGGASGIGRGMANAFAANRMRVVIADVEQKALDGAVAELANTGATVAGVQCDVADAAAVEAMRDRAYSEFGAVHVLCNNAGVGGSGSAATWEASQDDWDWVMGVNLMGVIHGIRSFIPAMIEQGAEAHIVNTASMAGLIPGMGIYGVSKHAVVALSESLYSELSGRGTQIGVSVLCPGWVRTRIMESERNRPEAPRSAPGAERPEAEIMQKLVSNLVEKGLEPDQVGQVVVDAIRAPRFYVLTHPHWKNMIESRMSNILDGRPPVGVPPSGDGSDWFPG